MLGQHLDLELRHLSHDFRSFLARPSDASGSILHKLVPKWTMGSGMSEFHNELIGDIEKYSGRWKSKESIFYNEIGKT